MHSLGFFAYLGVVPLFLSQEEHGWKWTKPPPVSRKQVNTVDPEERKRARVAIRQAQNHSVRYRLLKG